MKPPVQTLATAVLVVAIFLWSGATEFLTYHRDASSTAQVLTLLSAQFTHWNLSHLFCDTTAFLVLGSLIEARSPAFWRRLMGLSLVFVSLSVWLSPPEIMAYRGLSGIDAAFFSAAALIIGQEAARRKSRTMLVLAIGCGLALIGKIVWEWTTGMPLFARGGGTSFVIVPQTHLAGAIAGIACQWRGLKRSDGPHRPAMLTRNRAAGFLLEKADDGSL